MSGQSSSPTSMVTSLVPLLSRSLAEQFNVFRVMHHGTHEKQLSNVFAWLLDPHATHGLGDAFQRLFVERVNHDLGPEGPLPTTGYAVSQEVNTSGALLTVESEEEPEGRDIADIVLTHDEAAIVIENFHTSDGHGHSYEKYLSHGAAGGRRGVVVLLCITRALHGMRDGWENALVITYAEALADLRAHLGNEPRWRQHHEKQHFFINQMFDHFLEGPATVDLEDRIAFMTAMCETGESIRYSYRPNEVAAEEFAAVMADHARQQFEDGRSLLFEVKGALTSFARSTLVDQVNETRSERPIERVTSNYVFSWRWSVTLYRSGDVPRVHLVFGPTAATHYERHGQPVDAPDYTEVIVTTQLGEPGNSIVPTGVSVRDVIAGLTRDDTRLRDAVLTALA